MSSAASVSARESLAILAEDASEQQLDLTDSHFPMSRYKPLLELGRGRAGIVYLSRDRLLGKKVAVKTLRMLTGEQLIQFQAEARILCKLSHPNIVSLLDFGITDSHAPYMVLEYFEAITLQEYLDRNAPLNLTQFVSVSSKICEALARAHAIGIYHRDVKPSNILVAASSDAEFDVRLIDFGTAGLKENRDLTVAQGFTIAGTPAYMSPDMAAGKSFDPRSEVYSLGCVFFEALTGETPFIADDAMSLLHQHAHVVPPRLCEKSSIENQDLEVMIAKCLAKNPDDRYQTIEELGQVILDIGGVEATVATVMDETAPVSGRSVLAVSPTLLFSTIGALALLSVIALVMFVSKTRNAEPAPTVSFDSEKSFLSSDKLNDTDVAIQRVLKRDDHKSTNYLRLENLLRVVSADSPKPFAEKERDWVSTVAAAKEVYGVANSNYRAVRRGCASFYDTNKKLSALEAMYRRDISELESLHVDQPSGDDAGDLEEALFISDDRVSLADVLLRRKQEVEAERQLRSAYELRQKIKKNHDIQTASLLIRLGNLYRQRSEFGKARQYLSEARSIGFSRSDSRSARVLRFDVLLSAYLTEFGAHRYSDAKRILAELDGIEKREPTGRPTDRLTVLLEKAGLAARLSMPEERINALEEAVKQIDEKDSSAVALSVLVQLESVYYAQRRFRDAIQINSRIYKLAQARSDFPCLIQALRRFGVEYGAMCRPKEAESWFKKALSAAKERDDGGEYILGLISYGEYLRASTRSEEAMKVFLESRRRASNIRPPNEVLLGSANMGCGHGALTIGDYRSSERYYRAAILHEFFGDQRGFALFRLGSVCSYEGKLEQSLDFFKQSVRRLETVVPDDLLKFQVWCGSRTANWLMGRGEESVVSWKESDGKKIERMLLTERINQLGRIFLPGYLMVAAPNVRDCRRIVNAMRSKLGASDSYYVSTTKEFAILLGILGHTSEADSLDALAEAERRHVVFNSLITK